MSGFENVKDCVAFHAGTSFDAENDVVTTGVSCLMMPAFSKAIFAMVSPNIWVCSKVMFVMMESSGRNTLVQSNLPPNPTSITAMSTFCSTK